MMGLTHIHFANVGDNDQCSCGKFGKELREKGLLGKPQTEQEKEDDGGGED